MFHFLLEFLNEGPRSRPVYTKITVITISWRMAWIESFLAIGDIIRTTVPAFLKSAWRIRVRLAQIQATL
jgi:hypothetical protein